MTPLATSRSSITGKIILAPLTTQKILQLIKTTYEKVPKWVVDTKHDRDQDYKGTSTESVVGIIPFWLSRPIRSPDRAPQLMPVTGTSTLCGSSYTSTIACAILSGPGTSSHRRQETPRSFSRRARRFYTLDATCSYSISRFSKQYNPTCTGLSGGKNMHGVRGFHCWNLYSCISCSERNSTSRKTVGSDNTRMTQWL